MMRGRRVITTMMSQLGGKIGRRYIQAKGFTAPSTRPLFAGSGSGITKSPMSFGARSYCSTVDPSTKKQWIMVEGTTFKMLKEQLESQQKKIREQGCLLETLNADTKKLTEKFTKHIETIGVTASTSASKGITWKALAALLAGTGLLSVGGCCGYLQGYRNGRNTARNYVLTGEKGDRKDEDEDAGLSAMAGLLIMFLFFCLVAAACGGDHNKRKRPALRSNNPNEPTGA